MPEPALNPDPNLTDRLDALGRSLASRESDEPPIALITAMRARRRQAVVARIGYAAGIAALITLTAITYISLRPTPKPIQPIAIDTTPHIPDRARQSPTLANLRNMNRDGSPESLRFPTIASSGSTPTPAPTPTRAGDAHNPDSMARLIGASR